MKIAVASQNGRTVTGHAGRCRRFWVYVVEGGMVRDKELLETAREETFHDSPPGRPHPVEGMDVFICAGMGEGLARRLAARGLDVRVTVEMVPDEAVQLYLTGQLPEAEEAPPVAAHHLH